MNSYKLSKFLTTHGLDGVSKCVNLMKECLEKLKDDKLIISTSRKKEMDEFNKLKKGRPESKQVETNMDLNEGAKWEEVKADDSNSDWYEYKEWQEISNDDIIEFEKTEKLENSEKSLFESWHDLEEEFSISVKLLIGKLDDITKFLNTKAGLISQSDKNNCLPTGGENTFRKNELLNAAPDCKLQSNRLEKPWSYKKVTKENNNISPLSNFKQPAVVY